MDNLWTLKAVLQGFEEASGLKVNFLKSCLVGLNVPRDFMEMACEFLGCSEGTLPFKYLGLPIGANHRSAMCWEPLLEHMTKRLNSWGNKFLSFGGRIVLLNSVLNAIPIFYLSFLKMSVKVLMRLVRIQREFLWGSVGGERKINWVKWSKVCQPKDKGGLGIRDIRLVNLSLLAKWRWRILQGGEALWIKVLIEKYGNDIENLLDREVDNWPRYVSKWCKDIVKMVRGGEGSWFNAEVTRRVKNGINTFFWSTKWRGGMSLKAKYPRLFSISNQKDAMVAEVRVEGGTESGWNLTWRRGLFVWEEEVLNSMLLDLQGFECSQGEDEWRWTLEGGGGFTVRSMYKKLEVVSRGEEGWGEEENHVLSQIWKSGAPSRVVAFAWKGLLNRIPTRDNSAWRNVLPIGANFNCVFCNEVEETTNHLFLHCTVTWKIWLALLNWFQTNLIIPENLFAHWKCWDGLLVNRKESKRGMRIIWHTALWLIWNF